MTLPAPVLSPQNQTEWFPLARQDKAHEAPGHTLQPTALVHEAWLHLVVPSRTKWQNRAEFFSGAGRAMRRILVDHARRKQSRKMNFGGNRLSFARG